MNCDIDYAGDAEADIEAERAEWADLTPEEATGRAIYESKEEAVKEIRAARRESTILSYKMVIVGAMFGFLGSFLVSVILRWYDANWTGFDNFLLGILGIVSFFGSAIAIAILIYFKKV